MRIAVAMSGGMDSTAACMLLKRQGHEVAGFHIHLHEQSGLTAAKARAAAQELGIALHEIDLSGEFLSHVIEPFVESYSAGLTPSPCPMCNRVVKMTLLLGKVLELGYHKMATGHYARIGGTTEQPALLKGLDRNKDQSYFLFMLSLDILRRVMFPLGNTLKSEVRDLLRREGISAWQAPESQELCFIPDGDYRGFLRSRGFMSQPGYIKDVSGKVLGSHQGIEGYTVGQRRGLGVCGPEPYYVIRIDPEDRSVIIGTREQSLTRTVVVGRVNVLSAERPEPGSTFKVKIRSTSAPADCEVVELSGDTLVLRLTEPQSGVAAGQAAVLYRDEMVVAGGWIIRPDDTKSLT